jgi:hypothetical protein
MRSVATKDVDDVDAPMLALRRLFVPVHELKDGTLQPPWACDMPWLLLSGSP